MRVLLLVVSLAIAGGIPLTGAPQRENPKKPGVRAQKRLDENHEAFLLIWTEWMGKAPLKFDPIKEEARGEFVGTWRGKIHDPRAEEPAALFYRLDGDGTFTTWVIEDGEKLSESGHWYLHKGALQFWNGPISDETDGEMLMVVQKGKLQLVLADAPTGLVEMVRVRK